MYFWAFDFNLQECGDLYSIYFNISDPSGIHNLIQLRLPLSDSTPNGSHMRIRYTSNESSLTSLMTYGKNSIVVHFKCKYTTIA